MRKRRFLEISFLFLSIISLILIRVPQSQAARQLDPGHYITTHNTKSCTYITTNWTLITGGPIDVFLLTELEYNIWNHSELPVAPLFMEVGSMGGFYNTSLNQSVIYYLVFSNINGSATCTLELETYFYNCRTIMNLPVLVMGVFLLTCNTGLIILFNIRKRASEPPKKLPISHLKLFIIFMIIGILLYLSMDFIFNDFLIGTVITMNIILPIYVYFWSKYYYIDDK